MIIRILLPAVPFALWLYGVLWGCSLAMTGQAPSLLCHVVIGFVWALCVSVCVDLHRKWQGVRGQ